MPSNSLPIISVLTPTYNRAKTFLPQTIQSVARQREDGFSHEHIIVDNASTDGTRKMVAALAKKDLRIKYIYSRKNLKASGALNLAWPKSKGEIIVPFDDDDWLLPQGLQIGFDFFKAHPKIDWFYAFAMHFDADNRIRFDSWPTYQYQTSKQLFWALLRGNFVHGGTVMMRRMALSKVGGWSPVLAAQDYDMALKLAYAGLRHALLPQYQMLYRIHTNRESSRNNKNGLWADAREFLLAKYHTSEAEIKQNFAKLPKPPPIYY